jgi:toluene monooxygenase system protein D
MEDAVGPVLRMCDELEHVIQAIIDDNPDREVEVIDRGAYVRVQAPHFLRVTRASLQRHLGRRFEMRRLESMLSAFAGRIETSTDEMHWTLSPSEQTGPAEKDGTP